MSDCCTYVDFKDVAGRLSDHTIDGPLRMNIDIDTHVEGSEILSEIGAYACWHDRCNGMPCEDIEEDACLTAQTSAFFFATRLWVVVVEDWRQHVIRPGTHAFYLFSKDGSFQHPHLLLFNDDGRVLFTRTGLDVSLAEILGTDGYNKITEYNSHNNRCDGMRSCTECLKQHGPCLSGEDWDEGTVWKGRVLRYDDDTRLFLEQPCEPVERALQGWETVADLIIAEFARA